jgi:hypothetical protein
VSASRFRFWRIAVLAVILAWVAAWGIGVELRRRARTSWTRTLDVAVILLAQGAIPGATLRAVARQIPELERRLAAEMTRHRGPGTLPFALAALGPIQVDAPPPLPPAEDGLVDRARYLWDLRAYLRPIDRQLGRDLDSHDLRIYLVVAPAARGAPRLVEGAGAARGEIGLVVTTIDDATVDLALIAAAHELLHLVGATDKYDADGHALPSAYVEPAAGLPQRHADLMAGEIPIAPGRGRLAVHFDDVRVGPVTAAEIGWLPAATRVEPGRAIR